MCMWTSSKTVSLGVQVGKDVANRKPCSALGYIEHASSEYVNFSLTHSQARSLQAEAEAILVVKTPGIGANEIQDFLSCSPIRFFHGCLL